MTTKEKILKVVKKLPSNSSIEDVVEHLYLLYKIEMGIKQANAGKNFKGDGALTGLSA